jgi:hypothetical protein
MMQEEVEENHPTTRMFPRTMQEAWPKDYVNEDIITGAYREPQISDFAILCALIAIVGFFVYMFNKYIWS